MAQLSSVIGSILRDIVSAQHEANLYSLSLGDSYGKDGKAKDFQLPNVMVSDMELDLKYGVKSASESRNNALSYCLQKRVIKRSARGRMSSGRSRKGGISRWMVLMR